MAGAAGVVGVAGVAGMAQSGSLRVTCGGKVGGGFCSQAKESWQREVAV